MGNCLKGASADDISLLRGTEATDANIVPPPPQYRDAIPLFYPAPNDGRPVNQLSEEEQIKIARRIGLLEHLPIFAYDETINQNKECVICMIEFNVGEQVRYLPCVHIYHVVCIDNWLMRSFTCPSCMEPVDAALLTSYDTTSTVNSNTSPITTLSPVNITSTLVTTTDMTTTITATTATTINTTTTTITATDVNNTNAVAMV